MRTTITLGEIEIKQAIFDSVRGKYKGVEPSAVTLHYHNFDGSRDPRERSYFEAEVVMNGTPSTFDPKGGSQ